MKTIIFSALIIFISCVCYSQTEVTPYEAKDYEGEYVTVTGEIVEVYESRKGHMFLNFENKFPNSPFVAVVFSSDCSEVQTAFDGDWGGLINTTVKVTGIIEIYKRKPEIILKEAEQLEVVE